MNIIVCDTCSVIRLYQGGIIDCLGKLFNQVYIPFEVFNECNPSTQKIFKQPFFKLVEVNNMLSIGLGKGERAAISLAIELNIDVITDDHDALKKARKMGLFPLTSFDIAITAKDVHLIDSVKDVLDTMRTNGEGIDNSLYNQALEDAGESEG